jgi:hypothetical protein
MEDSDDPLFKDYGPIDGQPRRVSSRRPKQDEPFVQIPDWVSDRLGERRCSGNAFTCAMELERLVLWRGKNPAPFYSARLKRLGIVSRTRARALRQLEAAGLIRIKWSGPRKAPLVTCLWRL